MQKVVSLDYETFYIKPTPKNHGGYSVKTKGNWAYCNDERFDPYLLSVFDGSDSWVGETKNFNWDAIGESDLLIAHNAGFDSAVTRRLGELGQAPVLKNKWQCTANMTSFLASSRSLQEAILVLENRRLSKGIRDDMNAKHWADLVKAGKADEAARYALGDAIECHGLWTKYSGQWPQFEQDISSLTMMQCARGVAINIELLEKYRSVLQEVIFNLVKSFPWTERGAKPTSPIAIAEQCREVGIPAPPTKTDDEEGFNLWETTYGPRFPWVYGAGQWRSLNKLLSSLDTIRDRLRPDGTIDFSLLYFGGHTGRWSGGGSGLNMQNFRKIPLYIKNGHMVAPPVGLSFKDTKAWIGANVDEILDIRRLFIPRPGKKFILSDLAQIEPRVLAWMTNNVALLALIRKGMSVYEAFARTTGMWSGGDLKKENPNLYQLIKVQVLQLGYGCGWEKFQSIAATDYGVFLSEQQSQETVAQFRETNPGIKGLWKTFDTAFRDSVGGDYITELPSGRKMNYRNVLRAVRSRKDPFTGEVGKRYVFTAEIGSKRKDFYGGKLVENAVQAAARDVFASHLLPLEEQIGDVIFTVHDEAILEVENDVTPRDVEQVMSVCPDWLEGCPVAAEAQEAPHYLK